MSEADPIRVYARNGKWLVDSGSSPEQRGGLELLNASGSKPRTVMRQAGGGYPRWTMARFLATAQEGLRTLYETRPRHRDQRDWSPGWTVVESLARVRERQGLQSVGQLGNDAAAAWAHRIGDIR